MKSKQKDGFLYARKQLKSLADPRYWCTTHKNCYKCSRGKAESMDHKLKKFLQYIEYIELGFDVYTELRLQSGLRPDLVILGNSWDTSFIIEIVESEKEESIIKKRKTYPLPIRVIYC